MINDSLDIRFQFENEIIEVYKISNEIIDKPYPMHNHGDNCFEFHYVVSGNATIETDDKMIPVSKGTFYITGPFVRHAQFPSLKIEKGNSESIKSNALYREYGIYFNIVQTLPEGASENICVMRTLKKTPFIISHDNYKVYNIFKDIFFELENQQIGYYDNIISLLRLLIVTSVRLSPDEVLHQKINDNLDVIRNNKRNLIIDDLFMNFCADLTLPKLSRAIGFSERQTQRYLSKEYGKTFNQKKLEARMSAAKVMLMDESLSVDDIALKLGCVGNSKFLSSFKNYYGITARQFRKDRKLIDE